MVTPGQVNTSTLFHGMIWPLVPFSFRAVWWYQGVRRSNLCAVTWGGGGGPNGESG
jgi:hypothetical protein